MRIANQEKQENMNLNNFTIKSQEAVQQAQQMAMEKEHQAIELGHVMKSIMMVDDSVTPFILKKFGADPATSSTPLVTTIVDVIGLLIYFTLAIVILRGTLL